MGGAPELRPPRPRPQRGWALALAALQWAGVPGGASAQRTCATWNCSSRCVANDFTAGVPAAGCTVVDWVVPDGAHNSMIDTVLQDNYTLDNRTGNFSYWTSAAGGPGNAKTAEEKQVCRDTGMVPEDCECECATAGRVPLYVALALPAVYAFIVLFFVALIWYLRKDHKEEYRGLRTRQGEDSDSLFAGTWEWMSMSKDEVRREYGLDAAVYLLHCKLGAWFWFLQFACFGWWLGIFVYYGGGDYEAKPTIFAFSYANLAPSNPLRWFPALGQVWFAVTTVIFTQRRQKAMDEYKEQAEADGARHTSVQTAWIQNVAPGATEEALVAWFDRNFKGKVRTAKMVWDVNALGHNIRNRRRMVKKVNKLSDDLANDPHGKTHAKTEHEIETTIRAIRELEEWEAPLRSRGKRSGGSAFVTFTNERECLEFRRTLARQALGAETAESINLGVSRWRSKLAPRPAEIYWENFGLDANEHRANGAKGMYYTVLMFTVFICCAVVIMWTIGFLYFDLLYKTYPRPGIRETHTAQYEFFGPYVWYGVGIVFIVVFLALEEEMAPIVKFICKYESPETKSHKQSSYLGKIYWFYVIYHVALTTFAFGKLVLWMVVPPVPVTDPELNAAGITQRSGSLQLYVECVGMFHQNRLFLTACIIDFLHVMEGVKFFTRKGKPLTDEQEAKFQGAEDEEDDGDGHEQAEQYLNCKFDYTRNYGESMAVHTSISCYALMHPSMMWLGWMYFAIKYFVDKYQITNQYSRPHVQYGRRARTTTIYILWSQACAQFLNAVYFMVLADDMMDVGVFCFVCFLCFLGVTTGYVYQPQALKLAKTGTKAQHKIASLAVRGAMAGVQDSAASTPRDRSGAIPLEYNPPRPEDLKVGVPLRVGVTTTSNPLPPEPPPRIGSG